MQDKCQKIKLTLHYKYFDCLRLKPSQQLRWRHGAASASIAYTLRASREKSQTIKRAAPTAYMPQSLRRDGRQGEEETPTARTPPPKINYTFTVISFFFYCKSFSELIVFFCADLKLEVMETFLNRLIVSGDMKCLMSQNDQN